MNRLSATRPRQLSVNATYTPGTRLHAIREGVLRAFIEKSECSYDDIRKAIGDYALDPGKRGMVYHALWAMAERGELVIEGSRGRRVYRRGRMMNDERFAVRGPAMLVTFRASLTGVVRTLGPPVTAARSA